MAAELADRAAVNVTLRVRSDSEGSGASDSASRGIADTPHCRPRWRGGCTLGGRGRCAPAPARVLQAAARAGLGSRGRGAPPPGSRITARQTPARADVWFVADPAQPRDDRGAPPGSRGAFEVTERRWRRRPERPWQRRV